MATLSVRDVPNDLMDRLKTVARNKGHSVAQEVRELLEQRYAGRDEVIADIRRSWDTLPPTSKAEVDSWLRETRSRKGV